MNRLTLRTRNRGFTLIELMVVLAIVGILVAVAYPSYQSQMVRTRRTDAEAALTGLANALERFYLANNTYIGATANADGTGTPTIYATKSPIDGTTKFYDLTISACAQNTYTLRATPVAGGPQANDGNLELTSAGAKTRGGVAGW